MTRKRIKYKIFMLLFFSPLILILLFYFSYQAYTSYTHKSNLYTLFDPERKNISNVKCSEGSLASRTRTAVCYFSTRNGIEDIVTRYKLDEAIPLKIVGKDIDSVFKTATVDELHKISQTQTLEIPISSNCSLDGYNKDSLSIYGTQNRIIIENGNIYEAYGGFSILYDSSLNKGCVVFAIPFG